MLRIWKRKYNVVPDLLVIEGPKAGGHLGFHREQLEIFTDETYAQEVKKILTVVREIEADSHKNIPVVLAGGIYDRADMDRALALGVDGVQMGTRFVTTYECDADLSYKQAYIDCKKEQIGIVKSRSACRGVLFSIPLSNMVRIKLIKNVSIAWNTVTKRNPLLYHTCIDRGGERKSGRSTAVLWGKCLEGRKTGACGGHYGRTKVKSPEFWKCRYLSVFRIPRGFFSLYKLQNRVYNEVK